MTAQHKYPRPYKIALGDWDLRLDIIDGHQEVSNSARP